ncbi:AIPR family protein [Acholeplasma equifetale]|uniref:AIPR family protein n=1 Tax=Acholeplasma equifetale TaxID=264634 RepID=UPI00047B3EEA|nr:AIPR family protein [Acholeplasma equifetale]
MISKYYNELVEKYHTYGMVYISTKSDVKELLNRVFLYYNHFNADDTKLDEIEEAQVDNAIIQAVIRSEFDDSSFDFISVIVKNLIDSKDLSLFIKRLSEIDLIIAETLSGKKNPDTQKLKQRFIDLEIKGNDIYKVYLLFDSIPDNETKIRIREIVSNFQGILKDLTFICLFSDDINEIISDVETPTLYVKQGFLKLIDSKQMLIYGNEKSVITSISAKSLKDMYLKYGTSGLFASNLRFYVKSTKIDNVIKETIRKEPENFWYYNNGIIITCSDYKVSRNTIELQNFSIVNGGQTTTLIGNTNFDVDFGITCKIIKNKYKNNDENTIFLSKVAEASNTQKPIKVKDLIANRIEQHRLKNQYQSMNVFLQVKRGEKINKKIYPEKWQYTTNEEVGQMLFSFIYQRPGNAKNSKSAMLQNQNNYKLIFQSNYSNMFLLGLQYIKAAYNDWKSSIKKYSNDVTLLAIAVNNYFMYMALIGFYAKVFINEDFRNYIMNLNDFKLSENDEFKMYLSQNDIGHLSVFNDPHYFENKDYANRLFTTIYNRILNPAFRTYKSIYTTHGAGHFSKSDSNYYNNVLVHCIKDIKKNWNSSDFNYEEFLSKYFSLPTEKVRIITQEQIFDEYKPGLIEELKELRKRIYKDHDGKLNWGDIFSNIQLSRIELYKPRSIEDLSKDIKMRDSQIKLCGEEVLKIISKYTIL